jgi:hypothetical protein
MNRSFITAGKAIFTISNPSGERYTFRVTHKPASNGYAEAFFVSLLTGSDNENDYTYLGMMNRVTGTVALTKKSAYKDDSKPVRVIRWALGLIWSGKAFPEGYSACHEGKCGRCARLLTVPESVQSGFGPECIKLVF